MKSITKLLAASALAMSMAAGCTDYDNEISRLDDRVDQIEDTQIKSISQQIEAINLSLPKLEKTDAELKSYIESLQKSSDELEKSIAAANAKLADVQKALEKAVADAKSGDSALKDELVASINNAKADVVSQLNALKTEMTGKLDLVNKTIEELQDRDKDLEARIDGLKCYSDSLAKVTRDWASETFVMVDEYSKTVDDVASLKVLVESLDNSLSSVESKLAGQWKSDIETAIAPVRKQIEDAVLTMTGEYESAISDARKELTEAYQGELKNGLSDLESSMKSWISTQFDSYWSIDSTKAALASLRFELETQLNTQKTYLETLIGNLSPGSGSGSGSVSKSLIDSLSTQLENTRKSVADNNAAIQAMRAELSTSIENVTESYKSAIETAVRENNGKMDEKIEAKVKEANSAVASEVKEIGEAVSALDARVKTLEDSVSEIKTQISSLQDSIKALEDKISGIISQIASITYVPTYSDGMETVTYTTSGSDIVPGTFTLRLKIQPASLADDLAENWKTALSTEAVYTKTRAVAGDFVSLTIEDAVASDGVLAVTVSASALSEDFFNKALSASARITVTAPTSGQNISSQYVALAPENSSDQSSPISLSASSLDFEYKGGLKSFTLKSNIGWNASSSASWLKISASVGIGDATINVSAENNASTSKRTAEIVFTTEDDTDTVTVSVTQTGKPIPGIIGDFSDPTEASKGDIALKDGSFVKMKDAASMTTEQKANCVGIVFWTTKDTDYTDESRRTPAKLTDDVILMKDHPECTHGLIVALRYAGSAVCWQETAESVIEFQSGSDFNLSDKADYRLVASDMSAIGNLNYILGYQNTKVLNAYNAYCEDNGKSSNCVKPAMSIAEFAKSSPAPENSSGWFLPSPKELKMLIYKDVDDIYNTERSTYKSIVNEILPVVNGIPLVESNSSHYYLSSTENYSGEESIVIFYGHYQNIENPFSYMYMGDKSADNCRVRAVCAF